MKYKNWIIVLIIIGIALGIGAYFVVYSFGKKGENQNNYEATRTQANVNTEDAKENKVEENNQQTENKESKNKQEKTPEETQAQQQAPAPVETEISSFTTKIVTKDASRQKNIGITCNTLNNTIVEPGATLSFCNTVGQATTAKGYEKADIFDANG